MKGILEKDRRYICEEIAREVGINHNRRHDHFFSLYLFLLKDIYIYIYIVRFEPTPVSTAADGSSQSGDITTAPLRLFKTRFMEQY